MTPRILCCLAVIGLLSATPLHAAEVKLLAGAGFKSAVDQFAPEFARKTGHTIVPVYGSEGSLTEKINAGESFDVLLIGTSTVDKFIKEQKIVAATRKDISRAGLAVGVRKGEPKPDLSSSETVKQGMLKTKAVAYIGTGHSGEHFASIMQKLGIADQMKPKLKSLPPDEVTKATLNGDTDWAIWIAPGILAVPGLEVAGTFPAELQDYVSLTAGLSSNAKNADGGKALIAFMGADAVPAIKGKGWQTAPY